MKGADWLHFCGTNSKAWSFVTALAEEPCGTGSAGSVLAEIQTISHVQNIHWIALMFQLLTAAVETSQQKAAYWQAPPIC